MRQEFFRQDAKKAFRGAVGQQRVPQEFLEAYPIPLPALSDQRRIVARVEMLMERVREAKRLRANAEKDSEQLIRVSTEEILGRFSRIQLGQLLAYYKNGIYKPMHFYGQGCPSVRMFNIRGGKVNLDGAPLLQVTAEEVATYGLEPDDILVVRVNGSREIIGRAGLVPADLGPCTFESKTIRVRVKREMVDPAFVVAGLNSAIVRQQLTRKLKTSSGQFTINQDDLNRLELPFIDDMIAQRRIVAYLDQVQTQATALKRAGGDRRRTSPPRTGDFR